MKKTDQTLLDQMKIGELEIEHRKALFSLNDDDITALKSAKPIVDRKIDIIVNEFYELQTSNPEIALLIGDADTLSRLNAAQHRYILDLFSGVYDLEYVNNRLRIGLVHKRIGVEPRLYLSAIHTLRDLLFQAINAEITSEERRLAISNALEKLLLFDISLVVDTYIRSLLTEIEIAKQKSDLYAQELENKVRERTRQLEELSRTDPLTGLLNVRYIVDNLTSVLRAAQRRREPVSVVYIDVNDFKIVNDTQGHQVGDELLRLIGDCIRLVSRKEDICFRYGGDEFCVILPNCDEFSARDIYKQRLIDEIKRRSPELDVSVGIIQTGPSDYVEPETLLQNADKMMYIDKKKAKAKQNLDTLAS